MTGRFNDSFDRRLFPMLTLLAMLVTAAGIVLAQRGQTWAVLAAGGGGLLAVLAAWMLGTQIEQAVRSSSTLVAPRADRSVTPPDAAVHNLSEKLDRCIALLSTISSQQLISDRAKAIAYRDRDLDALRSALREEITRGNWESALRLADDMSASFGCRAESDQLREEISRNKEESTARTINDRLARIDDHIKAERWGDAHRDADLVLRDYPDVEQLQNIHDTINGRREVLKKQLRDAWNEAAYRRDTDAAIAHLRRLDSYLTPEEAEGMEETVRAIFREKITALREEFGKAVHDTRWTDAVRVGEQIVKEFPNARIAQEVRETMAQLRQRAHPGSAAPPPPVRPAAPQ